ncbi:MAG: hypothetical protein Q4P84_07700 [Elusimicrobiales bacterium]|nr:hypothetical protein [Elusimicrobiales bacterium]
MKQWTRSKPEFSPVPEPLLLKEIEDVSLPTPNAGAYPPSVSINSIAEINPRIKWHCGEDETPNHSPENGQFTLRRRYGQKNKTGAEQGASSAPVEITGKELGDYKDIKELPK